MNTQTFIIRFDKPQHFRARGFTTRPKPLPSDSSVVPGKMRYLRFFAYGSVISTYMLILIGGYVSASGSGLACPDWPTCKGQLVPALTGPVLVEYTHRLFALVVTFFVLATLLTLLARYREERSILLISTASSVLLVGQIFLGMVTVRTELNAAVTAAHLGLASGVFALVLVNALLVRARGRELAKPVFVMNR